MHCYTAWLNDLQWVQNSLARLVCNALYCSPSLPLLKSLHWLPVIERVEFVLTTMTYKVRLNQQPSYLLQHIGRHQPVRSLRSSNSVLINVPSIKTATTTLTFCITPQLSGIVCHPESRDTSSQPQFLHQLKGHLFQRVFGWPWLPGFSVSLPNWQIIYGAIT